MKKGSMAGGLKPFFFLRVTANAFRQSDPHVGPN
jgi:hypothetical protein